MTVRELNIGSDLNTWPQNVVQALNGLDDADWSTRREIIRALVKRVEIEAEQVRVVFRINPPPLAPQLPSEKDSQSLQHCGGRGQTPLRCSSVIFV